MLPLSGIRVLDVCQVMAGPFCCMMLGDMGADVIKIEPPETGDTSRRSMAFRLKGEDSPGFLALNRNKRSVALDLKKREGREMLHALVRTADVLVENNRPGVADRLGMSYDELRTINPRLIYASISGFGQNGPWAQRPGYDLIAQAMSGMLSATGSPGGPPTKSAIPIADLGAGLFTAFGILSALVAREKTGLGQRVESSLFETALGLSIWESAELWGTGKSPTPIGTANRMSSPYQAVRASDEYFVFGANHQKLWLEFLNVADRHDLLNYPQFETNSDRVANNTELIAALAPTFLTRTAQDWIDSLLAVGIPAGPILNYEQALGSEHAAVREMVMDVAHPVEGTYKSLGFPAPLNFLLHLYPAGATPAQIAAEVGNAPIGGVLPGTVYFVYNFLQRNVVNLDIQGLDMNGSWRFETPIGAITPGASWTHFTKFDQYFPGTPTFSVLGTSGYNQTFASIEDQGRANLGYENGPFSADVYANYTGKYKNWSANSVIPITLSPEGLPAGGGDPVKANVTWDFNVSYNVTEGGMFGAAQVFMDITNVFDKMPPFYNSANGYNNYAGNPVGRVTTIGLRTRF